MVRCFVGDLDSPIDALLDTGATWCVLPWDLADAATFQTGEEIQYSTRFGRLSGHLVRAPVVFLQEQGDPVTVQATWFLSEEWTGPMVIGWTGCLERMRFGLDPDDETFFFGRP